MKCKLCKYVIGLKGSKEGRNTRETGKEKKQACNGGKMHSLLKKTQQKTENFTL